MAPVLHVHFELCGSIATTWLKLRLSIFNLSGSKKLSNVLPRKAFVFCRLFCRRRNVLVKLIVVEPEETFAAALHCVKMCRCNTVQSSIKFVAGSQARVSSHVQARYNRS